MLKAKVSFKLSVLLRKSWSDENEDWRAGPRLGTQRLGDSLLRKTWADPAATPHERAAALRKGRTEPGAADSLCQRHGLFTKRNQAFPEWFAGQRPGWHTLEESRPPEAQR